MTVKSIIKIEYVLYSKQICLVINLGAYRDNIFH